MKITSSIFSEGAMIPSKYTCDGQDISPPLSWADVPEGTRSLALISDDPDTPVGTWVHWVVFNIPPDLDGFAEGVPSKDLAGLNIVEGFTDFGRSGYGGPCPPSGTHRYYFKLYALDTVLKLDRTATKKMLLFVMQGHVLAEAQLMGRYARQ